MNEYKYSSYIFDQDTTYIEIERYFSENPPPHISRRGLHSRRVMHFIDALVVLGILEE